jgi:SAM-dependent methyltransferase
MTTPDNATSNAAQTTYWNEVAGPTWTALQALLDRQLEPLGQASLEALVPEAGERIMDIGCGCGDTTLQIARRVGPLGSVVGVDISAPMLAVARGRAAEAGLSNATFLQADAQFHAFSAEFDAVYSRFGVMFFSDPVAAFRNIRSALKPGGRLAFVCWRAMAENPWMTMPLQTVVSLLPASSAPPPDPFAPGPFAFADRGRLESILVSAGFEGVRIAPLDTLIGADSIADAIETALQVGPLGAQLREAPERRAAVIGALQDAYARIADERGVRLPSATWIVTAR